MDVISLADSADVVSISSDAMSISSDDVGGGAEPGDVFLKLERRLHRLAQSSIVRAPSRSVTASSALDSSTRRPTRPRCCIIGLAPNRGLYHKPQLSAHSYKPELADLALAINELVKKERPGFQYTSIEVNLNVRTKMHRHRNNDGWSETVSFGSNEGGRLWVYAENGLSSLPAAGLEPDFPNGQLIPGTFVNTHHRFFRFDGAKAHYVEEFSGNRYSIVCYTLKRYLYMSRDAREWLEALQFPLPPY